MSENLRLMAEQLQHAFPFMVAASNGKGQMINTPRLIEAVVIASVLAAGTWLFLVPKLELQFGYMQQELRDVSDELKAMRIEVRQLQIDVAVDKARTAPLPTPQP